MFLFTFEFTPVRSNHTLNILDFMYVDTQKFRGTYPAQATDHRPFMGMRDPWLHGNANAKEANELSRMGQKPNMKERRKMALKTRCKRPYKRVQVKRFSNETSPANGGI